MARIGVFGGTFDPPHIAHLILAAEAAHQLELERVLWVLAAIPPHKKPQTIGSGVEDRIAMVGLMVDEDPRFELSKVDIDRPGPHYTVDTLKALQSQIPEGEFFLLMGADSLHDIPKWYQPEELLEFCTGIGVMCRPGYNIQIEELEQKFPGIGQKIGYVRAPLLEISSIQVRRRIEEGSPFRYFLSGPVYRYILDHDLYDVQK